MKLAAHILFFLGATAFVGGLFLPWEGVLRIYRDGRRQEITYMAFAAQEEAKAAAAMGIGIIVLSLSTAWMKRGIMAVSLIEMLLLIGLVVLICLHAKDALAYYVNANTYTSAGIRVMGPYVGLCACAVMFISRIFKIAGRDKGPAS